MLLEVTDFLERERFDALLSEAARGAVTARGDAARSAALENLRSLRLARVAVAAAVCAEEAPDRMALAMWQACEGVADDVLDEIAAHLCAARTKEAGGAGS